jgi:metal-responsive CopG/Arc/MetJ family transcriptional regulator
VPELITLKLEKTFLTEVDAALAISHYHSRTEFIREAMRDKLQELKLRQIEQLRGSAVKNVTEEEYERSRSKIPDNLSSKKLLRLAR